VVLTHQNTDSVVLINIQKFQKSISMFTYSKLNSGMKMTHVIFVYMYQESWLKIKLKIVFNERTKDQRCTKDRCENERFNASYQKKEQTAAVRMNMTRSRRCHLLCL